MMTEPCGVSLSAYDCRDYVVTQLLVAEYKRLGKDAFLQAVIDMRPSLLAAYDHDHPQTDNGMEHLDWTLSNVGKLIDVDLSDLITKLWGATYPDDVAN